MPSYLTGTNRRPTAAPSHHSSLNNSLAMFVDQNFANYSPKSYQLKPTLIHGGGGSNKFLEPTYPRTP